MFRETVVRGLRTGGRNGDGRDDCGAGNASNVRIEGVACSSTRLGNRMGDLNGETTAGTGGDDCVVGTRNGLVGATPSLPLILLR